MVNYIRKKKANSLLLCKIMFVSYIIAICIYLNLFLRGIYVFKKEWKEES